MLKFIVFTILAVLAGCSSSQKSEEAGPCDKNRPPISFKKSAELKDRVLAAISKGDTKSVAALAACDFIVEPTGDPDNSFYIRATHAAPILIQKLKSQRWSRSFRDQNGLQHEVETANGEYVLLFRRTLREEGPWYWAGYLSQDISGLESKGYALPSAEHN